jgi:hypothetical protein
MDLSHNLEGPFRVRFTELPDKPAVLSVFKRFVDVIRVVDAISSLCTCVASLYPPFGDVAGKLNGVKWWHKGVVLSLIDH